METQFARTGLKCPCGKSSDAYAENEDGSGKCFRGDCSGGPLGNGFFPNRGADMNTVDGDIMPSEIAPNEKFSYLSGRSISAKTFEFYGVLTKIIDDIPNEVGFKFPNGAVQIRSLIIPKSERGHFKTSGQMNNSGLFGSDKFDRGSREAIIITEGAYDALAAHEMLRNKYAAVAAKSSSTVIQEVKHDYDYINSFSKIYLCLDNDDVAQSKISQIAGMFDFNKVYHVKLTKHKDANAYLEAGDANDFIATVENARRFSPNSIISSFSEIRNALKLKQAEVIADYPFAQLQDALQGIHKGELVIMKGLTGIGKTEVCRAIVDHNLKTRKTKMATVFLEESQDTTIKGVATYQLKQPVMIPSAGFTDDDVMKAYEAAVKGDEDRLFIHSHFSGDSENELTDNLRFLVTVGGVELVFLDNLTMLVTGREGEDERLRIDRIFRGLRNLVNELKFALVLICHTNEDGSVRGSKLPDILTNTSIHLAREIPETTLHFTVKKARTQGSKEGPAGMGVYDTTEFVLKDPYAEQGELPSL